MLFVIWCVSMGSNLRVVDISPQGGFRVQTCRSGFFHFVYKPDLQQIVEPVLPFDYVSRLVAQVLYSSGPTRQKNATNRHEPLDDPIFPDTIRHGTFMARLVSWPPLQR